MKISHHTNISGGFNCSSGEVEMTHPQSLHQMTNIENNLVIALSVLPPGNVDSDNICLSVFVDGEQYIIFNDTKEKAKEFFKTFKA